MENTYEQVSLQSNYEQPQVPLPNATAVLVLGIISIIGCCCDGLPGLICGIIALILSNKDLKLLNAEPEKYTADSAKNLRAGRICAIIGLIISCLFVLYIIGVIIMFGPQILTNPQEFIQQYGHKY